MLALQFVGWLAAIFGIMLLFTPKVLIKINDFVNKVLLDIDVMTPRMRTAIGIFLCIASLVILFTAYHLGHRFGMK